MENDVWLNSKQHLILCYCLCFHKLIVLPNSCSLTREILSKRIVILKLTSFCLCRIVVETLHCYRGSPRFTPHHHNSHRCLSKALPTTKQRRSQGSPIPGAASPCGCRTRAINQTWNTRRGSLGQRLQNGRTRQRARCLLPSSYARF